MIKEFEKYKIGCIFFLRNDDPAYHVPLNIILDTCVHAHIRLPDIDGDTRGKLFDTYIPEAIIQKVFNITKGVPFYLNELTIYLKTKKGKVETDKIPRKIEKLVEHNLCALSDNQKTFITYAALFPMGINRDFIDRLLLSMNNSDFEHLEDQGWIVQDDEAYGISCNQLQEIILKLISDDDKRSMHKKIAELLEATSSDEEPSYYILGLHYHNAGEIEKAIKNYFIAGVQALKKKALHETVDIFKMVMSLLEFSKGTEKKKIYFYLIEMLIKMSLYVDPLTCIDACRKYQRLLEETDEDKGSLKKMFVSPFIALSQKLFKGGITAKTDIDGILNFEGSPAEKLIFSQLQLLQALLLVHKYNETELLIKEVEGIVKNNPLLRNFVDALNAQREIQAGDINQGQVNLKKIIHELEEYTLSRSRSYWRIYGYTCWVYESSFSSYGRKHTDTYIEKIKTICRNQRFHELMYLVRLTEAEKVCVDGRHNEFERIITSLYDSLKQSQYPSFLGTGVYRLLIMELYQLGEFEACERWAERLSKAAAVYEDIWLEIQAGLYLSLSQFENKKEEIAFKYIQSLVEKAKNHYGEQVIPSLLCQALLYSQKNDKDNTEKAIRACMPRIDDKNFEGSVYLIRYYSLMGWLKGILGGSEEGVHILRRGLSLAQKNGNLIEEGKLYILLALYYYNQKDIKNSILCFESASAKFIMTDNNWWLSKVSEQKGKIKSGELTIMPDKEQLVGREERFEEHAVHANSKSIDTLLEFSRMVVSTLDLKLILQTSLEQSISLVRAERGFLILINDIGEGKVEMSRILNNGTFIDGSPIDEISSTIVQEVINTGEAVCIEDAQKHSSLKNAESVRNLDIRTVIGMPLKSGNKLIGLIYVDRPTVRTPFTSEEINLLKSLSGYASMALVNARLHNQIKERAEKLQMLNELSRTIASSTFLYTVAKQVLNYCLTVTKADKGYMFLGPELEFKGGVTSTGEELESAKAGKSVSRTIIRKVLLSGKSLVVSDTADEKELASSASIVNLNIQSAMCVPMIVNNQVIGVVYVSSDQINKQFDVKHLNILESIISQASLAVENAQLLENQRKYISDLEKAMKMYQRAQEKANTDTLTGLCNHGYFMDQLNREFIMSKRYGNVFSVIFIDIDLFKEINDTYGHQAGDKVLKEVSVVIRSECRETDLGARYGGDEMAIILANTDADRAFIISERLRANINKLEIPNNHEKKNVQASIGVAAILESDSSTKELLERVDQALYTAKENGRNRVCRWGDMKEVSIEQIRKKIKQDSDDVSDIVSILGAVSSLKDKTTSWHSMEMGDLAVEIGKEYNLSREQINEIKMAAVLHDIGKVGVPDSILKKEGPLNQEEWKIMRSHTKYGRDIVKRSNNLKKVSQAIYYHHERWDGKGYPEGLKGEQIPLTARLVAILDAFEAMVCDRPYRKALSFEEALQELERNAGTQFDPKLVKSILKHKNLFKQK